MRKLLFNKFFALVMIGLLAFPITGCKKAGKGGKAQLNIHVRFNGIPVNEAEVWVKYNAESFPGTNASYNSSEITDHRGLAIFENLRRGHYYFYVAYTDSTVSDSTFEAGAHMQISNKIGEQHVVIEFLEEDPF